LVAVLASTRSFEGVVIIIYLFKRYSGRRIKMRLVMSQAGVWAHMQALV